MRKFELTQQIDIISIGIQWPFISKWTLHLPDVKRIADYYKLTVDVFDINAEGNSWTYVEDGYISINLSSCSSLNDFYSILFHEIGHNLNYKNKVCTEILSYEREEIAQDPKLIDLYIDMEIAADKAGEKEFKRWNFTNLFEFKGRYEKPKDELRPKILKWFERCKKLDEDVELKAAV